MRKKPHTDDKSIACYLNDIRKTHPLSREEEQEIFRRINSGDEKAKETIINANLRFVVSVALKYQNQGMPLSDLINEGNMGLIRAVESFDTERNIKFISYAVWWIRQSIINSLAEQSRITRIPINKANILSRLRPSIDRFEQKNSRSPSEEELAEDLGVSVDEMKDVLYINKDSMSLDERFGDDNDSSLMDLLGADDSEIEEIEETDSQRKMLDSVLEVLENREAEILKLYYGIGYETDFNLEQIGRKFSISKERIRQIKENAFKKLSQFKSRGSYLKALYN
ncbi:MAG: RNA polymerase sigma factor RpoD/SigA [Fibrobacterota bacterium]